MIHEKPKISSSIIYRSIAGPDKMLLDSKTPIATLLKLSSPSDKRLKDYFPEGPLELASIIYKLENTPKGGRSIFS